MLRKIALIGVAFTTIGWHPPCFYGHTLSISLDKPHPYVRPHLTTQQRERALALTLFGEARSDGVEGMRAVGFVIMNRVRREQALGRDYHVENAVWSRKQFSCWNRGDPNRETLRHIGRLKKDSPDDIRWTEAKGLSHMLIRGRAGADPTHGATFYHIKSVRPYWVVDMTNTATIKDHIFYRVGRNA